MTFTSLSQRAKRGSQFDISSKTNKRKKGNLKKSKLRQLMSR